MGSIRVSGLGKAYKQYPQKWSRLLEWIAPASGVRHKLKWVLQGINFQINPGEAVGIIGVNGAGKSTLLKLITGTITPTTGAIAINGRIAALLELGIGFHPDMTGRENVAASCQIQGLSVGEIAALIPSIEAFAQIGDDIDQPVRHYSSGMQMRLAFSVATCVRPDILIVDEALAVGDVFFQQKCFDRIREFVRLGTTLLFVSHSSNTVLNICSRCLFIRQGALAFDGATREAIDLYQADLLQGSNEAVGEALAETSDRTKMLEPIGSGAFQFDLVNTTPVTGRTGSIDTPAAECVVVRFTSADGIPIGVICADQEVKLHIAYRLHKHCNDPHVGFKIRNRLGVVIFETNSYCMRHHLGAFDSQSILATEFTFAMRIFPDEYTVTVGLGNGGYDEGSFVEVLSYLHEVAAFTVTPNPAAITWSGIVNLEPHMRFREVHFSVAAPQLKP